MFSVIGCSEPEQVEHSGKSNVSNSDSSEEAKKEVTLQFLGDPYTDEQIAGAAAAVDGSTEMDALVAYLQELGTNRRNRR